MSVTVHACFQRSRSAVSSLAAQTQPIQLQLQTTADLLHLAMNVDICITLARRYVADIVTSGEPLSQSSQSMILIISVSRVYHGGTQEYVTISTRETQFSCERIFWLCKRCRYLLTRKHHRGSASLSI